MKPKLKPCPFCGGKAILMDALNGLENPNKQVICSNCNVRTARYYYVSFAIIAWNRRVNQ